MESVSSFSISIAQSLAIMAPLVHPSFPLGMIRWMGIMGIFSSVAREYNDLILYIYSLSLAS
jgi:hypothetical protein